MAPKSTSARPTSPTPTGVARYPSPDKILDYLDGLDPLTDSNCYQSVRLQKVTMRAHSTPKELIYHTFSVCFLLKTVCLRAEEADQKGGVLGHTKDLEKI